MNKGLQATANAVTAQISSDVISINDDGIVIVKAPPGAGKTYLLLQLLETLKKTRVAVACFTNAQADDICRRCAGEHPNLPVVRYLSSGAPRGLSGVPEAATGSELPAGPVVVVANTAKWALSKNPEFDYLLVDEAWQIAWADLMLLRNLASRVVLIGDPGQIPPVVSIETDRWETSLAAPHRPAPEHFLLKDPTLRLHALPGSRRLPADTVKLVKNFYDFDFGAFADPGERFVRATGDKSPIGRAISTLSDRSISTLLLPTASSGPPVEIDDEIAVAVAELIVTLLNNGAVYSDSEKTTKKPALLKPEHIGIVATHRSMNTRILNRLPAGLRPSIKVDTTERWQGLERKLMIAVHPLSSTSDPSAFDLETGRLCVMASRHQSGLVVVSRDHVRDTLSSHIPTADQPLGRPDTAGRGLAGHRGFWTGITT
jgi:hypothetical protein